ncbi:MULTISPECIES: hypothetical protein [Pseudomonas]|jgi:hypothetical protein|uniref:hypothetical protein n=1 Tax=Pseudomonas TaxID=286 RepID=UPI0013762230|nr:MULTISPECIES: hypothetical protein [Pseudomonas]
MPKKIAIFVGARLVGGGVLGNAFAGKPGSYKMKQAHGVKNMRQRFIVADLRFIK